MAKNTDERRSKRWGWLLPVLLLAPLELGAKGCDSAVVGDDCAPGSSTHCAGSGGDSSTGGSASSGGSSGTGGKASTGGRASTGGSSATGGSSGTGGAGTSKTCGGLLGTPCASGQYCDFPADAQCGAADQTGLCQPVPGACNDIFQPVCGCDGKTYGNACEAAAASVSVAAAGACASGGATCGSLAGGSCLAGEYCNIPIGGQCGAADQPGTCTPIPDACDTVYQPVCGCDGKTYGNSCAAAAAGVSLAARGECQPPVATACGARLGNTCASTEYCSFTPEAMCGRADATGTCAAIPAGCTKELVPVCGCNGVTYSNACLAASAGVSVDYAGKCTTTTPTGQVCGGLRGLQCDTAQYCAFPLETRCGSGDQTGACASKPDACTAQYDPVCGCDGKTYGNACAAANAGMSVSATGECP